MFSKMKNTFKNFNKTINNENGSILAVAIIIISVLSFSVATIAGMSINLASNTTSQLTNLNEESEAKASIKKAINFFEEWIKDPINGTDFDTFDGLYTNNPNDIFGVTVINDTSSFPELDGTGYSVARAYKFSVTLSNGNIISMHDFVSDVGVETTQFEPFEYTIGTSGDLVINSGFFGSDDYGIPDPLKMFGNNIYFSRRAPFILDGTTNNQELTSNDISRNPVLTDYSLSPSVAAHIHYNNDLQYCGDSTCYTLNDIGNPMELNKDNYSNFTASVPSDQGTIGAVTITDFFGSFNYNDYIMEFIRREAPSGSAPTNGSNDIEAEWSDLAHDIYDNSSPLVVEARYHPKWGYLMGYRYTWPNAEFVDITENVDAVNFWRDFVDEDSSFVYFGNDTNNSWYSYDTNYIDTATSTPLHLDSDIHIGVDESLIVFGDLYLDAPWGTQNILGEIVVTGDCYITGSDKDWEGSLMVFGETFIELDDDEQFRTNGQNAGITFMCKDNIHFISHDETHYGSTQSSIFYMFIYTEESIYVDAVNSRYNYSGVMYARALGNSKRTDPNDYMMTDSDGNPIRGIVVNSFYGYVDNFGVFHDGFDIVDSFRFNIDIMSSSSYASKFENLPDFPSEVIVSTGDLNF